MRPTPPSLSDTARRTTATPLLGTWRLLLALLVVNGHFHDQWWASTFAVFSFYVISGYLMTLIMNRSYGYTPKGIRSFAINRVLRIYPPYWAAAALSLLAIATIPREFVDSISQAIQVPQTASAAVSNVAIFGLHMGDAVRLVPPAWALHIELCHYVAIGLVLGRSPVIGVVWLAASLAWFASGSDRLLDSLYFTVLGSSLPFALGSCVYHLSARLPAVSSRGAWWMATAALAIYLAPYAAVQTGAANALRWGFFSNIAATAVLLLSLVRVSSVPAATRRIDQFLGDLSYPVYLFHFPVGVFTLFAIGVPKRTIAAFAVVAAVTLLASVAEARWLSRPIERWRSRVKASAQSA